MRKITSCSKLLSSGGPWWRSITSNRTSMTEQITLPSPDITQRATELVIRVNAVSVSLLQRHFRLGYQAGLALVKVLEESGIITSPGPDGHRALTPRATSMRSE